MPSGGVCCLISASSPVMSAMMAAVAPRSALADSRCPSHADRSTGGPATIWTVLRGNRLGFFDP
jgi:hypothetical protein